MDKLNEWQWRWDRVGSDSTGERIFNEMIKYMGELEEYIGELEQNKPKLETINSIRKKHGFEALEEKS